MRFNEEARIWDTPLRIERAKVIANEMKKHLNEGKTALEFGCGTGLISFALKDHFESVTLVDTSEEMIQVTQEKIDYFKASHFEAKQMNLLEESLPYKYDVIYTSMVMHHIVDTEKTLQILYSLLNDNGLCIIVDLDLEDGRFHLKEKDFIGHNGFDQSELKKNMERIGFRSVDSYTFYHDVKTIEQEEVPYSLFILTGKK